MAPRSQLGGVPIRGLPPTVAPPTTGAPDRRMASALCCPLSKGPYPRAVGGDFLLSGGPRPVLSTSRLLCPHSLIPRKGEALGGWGRGSCCQYSENRTRVPLPGRNVAVVHVSRDHNADPASISLKEPQTQKPSLLRLALPPQSPIRKPGRKGIGERGCSSQTEKE